MNADHAGAKQRTPLDARTVERFQVCASCAYLEPIRLRRRWSQLIKRVYEVDPLMCPSCGSEMKIIAFIVDHAVVDAILRHLGPWGRVVT